MGAWPWTSRQPLLTAWDPGDERPGDELNRRRQAVLKAELRPLASALWDTVGIDPLSGHREEGVAACGVTEDDALAIGRHYRQDAIFVWTPAEWVIVRRARAGAGSSTGWSLGAWPIGRSIPRRSG